MEAEMSDFSRITKSYKRKLKIIEKTPPPTFTIHNNKQYSYLKKKIKMKLITVQYWYCVREKLKLH